MRVLVTTLACGLLLGACATRPQVAHEGNLSPLKGQVVMAATTYQSSQATPTGADATLAKAVEVGVESRLLKQDSVGAGVLAPRYLLRVAVATSPMAVGISAAAGPQVGVAPWRGAPVKRHFWNRRGPVRTATLSVLDLSTGQVVAWSTVRTSSASADDLADRLVAALSPTKA
jgi:transposase InsO family protein